jgi:NADH-quinone oxidoreductase subunit E
MTTEYPRPLPRETVDAIIARHCARADRTGDVLGILEEAQRAHPQNYLPVQTYAYVAQETGVPPSQIMSVVTFYAFFNRRPQGRHTLTVCRGTACHTRGSRQLLAAIMAHVGVHDDAPGEAGEGSPGSDGEAGAASTFTTPDGRLTVRTVACFGQCAQAPVVAIDEAMHGHVSDFELRALVAALDGDAASGTVDAAEGGDAAQAAGQESAR